MFSKPEVSVPGYIQKINVGSSADYDDDAHPIHVPNGCVQLEENTKQ